MTIVPFTWTSGQANKDHRLDRSTRVELCIPVKLELGDGAFIEAIADNLSNDGFRIRPNFALHKGQILNMHMGRDIVQCEVRWAEDGLAGGVFTGA